MRGCQVYGVMIVDDHALYRHLLRAMLEREDDFQVLAEAGDVGEALELIDRANPDLILWTCRCRQWMGSRLPN